MTDSLRLAIAVGVPIMVNIVMTYVVFIGGPSTLLRRLDHLGDGFAGVHPRLDALRDEWRAELDGFERRMTARPAARDRRP